MPKLIEQKITPHPGYGVAPNDEVGEIALSRWQLSLIQRAMNVALIQMPVNSATLLQLFTQEERDELQMMIGFCDEFDTTKCAATGNKTLNGWTL